MTIIYKDPSKSTAARTTDLISRMTIDEKLAQVGSCWFYEVLDGREFSAQKADVFLKNGIGQITRIGGSTSLEPVSAARAGNAVQHYLVNNTRLGIPAILHEECCAGYMGLGGTVFPQMIGLASTFRPELAEKMTTYIRRELLAIGARHGLAPVLDVARDPRWGRTEETFGEDPLLIAHFGMAYIKGLQGDDLKEGVMATGKHFIGHSLSLGGLNCGPVQVGPRMMRDDLLLPFQAAIGEANLHTIMNSYPELDGELVAASRKVLTELLREELGFTGPVVSDYDAIPMINFYHKVAEDNRQAAVKALNAGIDLEMPNHVCYKEPLKQAVEVGEISMDILEQAIQRHLQKKFELGLFENPFVDEGRVTEIFSDPAGIRLAEEIARESIVLLKNEGELLPLETLPCKIAVIGPNADDRRNMLGDYSYAATSELMMFMPMVNAERDKNMSPEQIARHTPESLTVLGAIKQTVAGKADIIYAKGCAVLGGDRSGFAEAVRAAQEADLVILVLGDKAGLTPDCTSGETRDRTDLELPGLQLELAQAVAAVGKPVVAVLINGRPLSVAWLDANVAAIVEAWLPGSNGAMAVVDVLLGKVNPGGRLPISIPRSAGQVPVYYNHRPSGRRSNWYVDYVEMPVTPLYPFGYGLSYTRMVYSDLKISASTVNPGGVVGVSLRVTNAGSRPGDEVVQLYTNDEFACVPRPVKELKGYKRMNLQPGESRTVTFQLPVDMLAFHDENLNLVVEAGKIKVMIGSSSADIRLEGEFSISGKGKTQVGKRLFTCPVQ